MNYTFKLSCGLRKAGNSSRILFHSSVSTTCVPEGLSKGRYELPHVAHICNGKCQTNISQRPYSASFSSEERQIHTAISKHFCSKLKENNGSDKNEEGFIQNNKGKVNKSKSNLYKKRSFYKIKHQNLVWAGCNKQNRQNKSKMSAHEVEKYKELAEKRLKDTHNMPSKNFELKSDKENKKTEVLKTQDSSANNILTIDIFSDSERSAISHLPQFKAKPEDIIDESSEIDTKTTSTIDNSGKLKEAVVGNCWNNRKIGNNDTLINKSKIKDCKKENLPLLNQNKVPINEIVLNNKYEPYEQTKNIMEEDNSTSLHAKDHCMNVSDKKFSDDGAFKVPTNSIQNINNKEMRKDKNLKTVNSNKTKLVNFENKNNLDIRKHNSGVEEKGTVWNTIYRQKNLQMLTNDLRYHINLKNKIQNSNKNIDLNQRYKFAHSINSILKPLRTKLPTPNERYYNQILPKCVNHAPTVPLDNSILNIAQKTTHPNNYVFDSKSMSNGIPHLSELLKNTIDYYSFIKVSREKPWNKIQLIKGINSANSNKKAMVNDLKSEITYWKKYEYLRKVILESTSEIYQSITNGRKIGKITKNKIYAPRKKIQKKCNVISIPLSPTVDINKYKKTNLIKLKTSSSNNTSFSSKPDPIETLKTKYKKNYHTTFNDVLKKNEILICQEKFKKNPEILEYNLKNEFQTEKKSGVLDKMNSRNITKDMFINNRKKVSMENKKPWVRYLHQMNDDRKDGSSTVSEISTYPSGVLKKPEFIIELLQLEDARYEDMKKLSQHNISGSKIDNGSLNITTERSNATESNKPTISSTLNKKNEKSESSIIEEPTNKFNFNKIDRECKNTKLNIMKHEDGKGKSISFSDLHNIKSGPAYQYKNTVSENECAVLKKKNVNQKIHCAISKSPLDQEHSLIYEGFEENEPKVYNVSPIQKIEEVKEVGSKETFKLNNSDKFQTKRNLDDKINSDCESINLNNAQCNNNKKIKLKDDQFPTNNIEVEVCSNIIYEQPVQNVSNSQEIPEENKTYVIDKQHPKSVVSSLSAQENIASKNNSLWQNQLQFLTQDSSKEIKPEPVNPSSQQLHAIEILFNSSQPQQSISKELEKSKETQTENLNKATTSKTEFKNNMALSYICGNQDSNSCENSNEYHRANTSYYNEKYSRDIKLQHSNHDKNNLSNHFENVNCVPTKVLGEETTISNSSVSRKGLVKEVNAPLLILHRNKKYIKEENLISGLKHHKTTSECDLQKCVKQKSRQYQNVEETDDFQNVLNPFKQTNSFKVENMNADINEFKFITFLKKCYPEISNNNNKAFIDNIKRFFRISCNYFKLDNTNILSEGKFSMDNVLSHFHHSKEKHNTNHDISNSFKETSLKQPGSFPKRNKQFYISEVCKKPAFYQEGVNNNNGEKIKLMPSLPKHGKEDRSLSGNEEFKRRFSNMLPVSPKDDFQTTFQDSEQLIRNEEISINDLEKGTSTKKIFYKPTISKTENSLGKTRHHNSFLSKVNDKDFEKLYVNQVKQHRSFCNLNHKKSYMKLSSRNRLHNHNIKNKLRGFHYSMHSKLPLVKSPDLVKSRGKKRGEMVSLKWKLGLKPVMKNSKKLKKNHFTNLNSDAKIKLRVTEKLNLLKTIPSFQKLSDKSNPESYWLNCFSKNIFTEDKLSCNEFLTYIKKRKLPAKSSFNSNN